MSNLPLLKKKRIRRHDRAWRSNLRIIEMLEVPDKIGMCLIIRPAQPDVRQIRSDSEVSQHHRNVAQVILRHAISFAPAPLEVSSETFWLHLLTVAILTAISPVDFSALLRNPGRFGGYN